MPCCRVGGALWASPRRSPWTRQAGHACPASTRPNSRNSFAFNKSALPARDKYVPRGIVLVDAQNSRVLISVTDKTGIVIARDLAALGAEIISTGGTARMMREAGIPVGDVCEVTGFPEMLDGRVKTMHPSITGGILAMRGARAHGGAGRTRHRAHRHGGGEPLPLRRSRGQGRTRALEELIENIDIGGPTMIRSAAKNYQDVAVVVSPADYPAIARRTARARRRALARDQVAAGAEGLPHHRRLRSRPSARAWRRWMSRGRCPAALERCARPS